MWCLPSTKNNDQSLREKQAAEWNKVHNANYTPEMINCVGCKGNGEKLRCSECEVYICASGKGVENCGTCEEFETCKIITEFFNAIPSEYKEVKAQFLKNLGR